MADRETEPLPRRRAPAAPSPTLLPADLTAGRGTSTARTGQGAKARRFEPPAASFLAPLDPLPSDYYLG